MPTVRITFADHEPPHVQVTSRGHVALVNLEGQVIEGSLPRRAAAVVAQWCLDNEPALLQIWLRAQSLEPLARIAGIETH